MSARFYPLAASARYGILKADGEKPVAARFLTIEEARDIARKKAA